MRCSSVHSLNPCATPARVVVVESERAKRAVESTLVTDRSVARAVVDHFHAVVRVTPDKHDSRVVPQCVVAVPVVSNAPGVATSCGALPVPNDCVDGCHCLSPFLIVSESLEFPDD